MSPQIPEATSQHAKHWPMPDRSEIWVDQWTATMTRETFDKLLNYKNSEPTGTWAGKMWRSGGWLRFMADDPEDSNSLLIYSRRILLVELR